MDFVNGWCGVGSHPIGKPSLQYPVVFVAVTVYAVDSAPAVGKYHRGPANVTLDALDPGENCRGRCADFVYPVHGQFFNRS